MNNIIDFMFGSTFSWLLALRFFFGDLISFRLQLLANMGELSDLGYSPGLLYSGAIFWGYPIMICYAMLCFGLGVFRGVEQ